MVTHNNETGVYWEWDMPRRCVRASTYAEWFRSRRSAPRLSEETAMFYSATAALPDGGCSKLSG